MLPGTQEPWLLGSVCTSSCWQDSRPLTQGGQMRSPSPYPISSSHHHQHTPLTPTPPLSPFLFRRCLVTLAPVILPLPSWWRREGERERLQPTTTVSLEAPCLPACLTACPSCCSVQLWLSTRPWAAGISTLPESLEKSLSVWKLLISLRWLFIRWNTQTLTPTTAAKALLWGWEDPLWAWLWHPMPWHFPWCSPCSAWHRRPLWEAARRLAGAPSPCCSAWSPMVSPASRHWQHKRVRMWRRCEYDVPPALHVPLNKHELPWYCWFAKLDFLCFYSCCHSGLALKLFWVSQWQSFLFDGTICNWCNILSAVLVEGNVCW